jgi:hypothetical protein
MMLSVRNQPHTKKTLRWTGLRPSARLRCCLIIRTTKASQAITRGVQLAVSVTGREIQRCPVNIDTICRRPSRMVLLTFKNCISCPWAKNTGLTYARDLAQRRQITVRHLIGWNIARVNLRATGILGSSPSMVRNGNTQVQIFAGSIQAKLLFGAIKSPPCSSFGYLLKRVRNHGDHRTRSMTRATMNPTIEPAMESIMKSRRERKCSL